MYRFSRLALLIITILTGTAALSSAQTRTITEASAGIEDCGATNCLEVPLFQAASFSVSVSGEGEYTLSFEARGQQDAGYAPVWHTLWAFEVAESPSRASSSTAPGLWVGNNDGYAVMRVRATALTQGTPVVTITRGFGLGGVSAGGSGGDASAANQLTQIAHLSSIENALELIDDAAGTVDDKGILNVVVRGSGFEHLESLAGGDVLEELVDDLPTSTQALMTANALYGYREGDSNLDLLRMSDNGLLVDPSGLFESLAQNMSINSALPVIGLMHCIDADDLWDPCRLMPYQVNPYSSTGSMMDLTEVFSGPGTIRFITCDNNGADHAYLRLADSDAMSVVIGTTPLIDNLMIPAGGGRNYRYENGRPVETGLVFWLSGDADPTNDDTPVDPHQVRCSIHVE